MDLTFSEEFMITSDAIALQNALHFLTRHNCYFFNLEGYVDETVAEIMDTTYCCSAS